MEGGVFISLFSIYIPTSIYYWGLKKNSALLKKTHPNNPTTLQSNAPSKRQLKKPPNDVKDQWIGMNYR